LALLEGECLAAILSDEIGRRKTRELLFMQMLLDRVVVRYFLRAGILLEDFDACLNVVAAKQSLGRQ
jgi:hypothetical protein